MSDNHFLNIFCFFFTTFHNCLWQYYDRKNSKDINHTEHREEGGEPGRLMMLTADQQWEPLLVIHDFSLSPSALNSSSTYSASQERESVQNSNGG